MGARVDGRVDQYACGVMAYEAIVGLRPNDGTHDGETLANILSGKHVPIMQRGCDLPEGLGEVIERMLSVSPDQRFPTMDGVVDAIEPFAPPMTAHRELAELVLKARPAQTIVMQDGVFVSRLVAQETLQREPTPRGRRRSESGSGPRVLNNAFSNNAPYSAEVLSAGAHTHTQPSLAQAPGSTSQPISYTPKPPPALPIDDAADARRLTGRPNGRLQALFAGAGALVLGALSWVVFSADGWSTSNHAAQPPGTASPSPPSLAPNLPQPSTGSQTQPIATAVAPPSAAKPGATGTNPVAPTEPDRVETSKSAAGPSALSPVEIKPRRTYREKREQDKDKEKDKDSAVANTASKSPKNNAIAKVKVFPWGRVWVDGKLQGSVPPILEVNLTPGPHEIAVGHERPMESRSVSLAPGATQLVAFDLEGR